MRLIYDTLTRFDLDNKLERDEEHFDPSARLRWQVGDDTMVYLSWSEGYKSGGFNTSSDTSNPDGTPGPGTTFGDESAEAWELGIKTTQWDGRMRISAAVFQTEIQDLQVTSFRGTTRWMLCGGVSPSACARAW